MKLTTLACLAALGLLGPETLATAAPAAPPSAQAQPSLGRAGPPSAHSGDKRRRSYAACNRASHARALHGGRRRRFLIRCKLGYERPRTPSAAQQQAAPTAAPTPATAPVSVPPTPSAPAPAERRP
ncbi:hypothetical protein MKK70_20300 [Methylobacterium sp. E-041]|uniref:hypothetical protein n=1 Tax=Methylobacterium sp. E-041 TaxID=2836573 RepID=UPI001FBB76F3|nr:hypothetical protein [Methylobacterium sp. E-041]MCJ2107676.1 hypothetical protein [Methylobacterium sp. E-041]